MEINNSAQNSLFTMSNNVFEEKIQAPENVSDNLIFTHSGGQMELHLRIERMKKVLFPMKTL